MTRLLMLALCLVMLTITNPTAAYAFERVDLEAPNSLMLIANYDGEGIPAVQFVLHRVGIMNADAQFDLDNDFSEFVLDINSLDHAEDWVLASETLAEMAAGVAPDLELESDVDGIAMCFDLTPGLYLVQADYVNMPPWLYTFAPFLVSVPTRDMDDEWVYDVVADVKMDRIPHLTDVEVLKVWEDEGHTNMRPRKIQVTLLQDGVAMQKVTLRKNNNWHYVFTNLPNGHLYTVVEEVVPSGYLVEYKVQNGVLVVVNSYDGVSTPPPDLPQTGQLTWPIPILAGLGTILFVAGWFIHRKWSQEHEEP